MQSIASRAGVIVAVELLKANGWILHLTDNKAPPTARDSNGITLARSQRWPQLLFEHCVSPWSVGWCIQDEAIDFARPSPYLSALLTGNKERGKGFMVLGVGPAPTRLKEQHSLYPVGQHSQVRTLVWRLGSKVASSQRE